MGFEHAPGGALVQIHFGADLAGDAGDLVELQMVQVVALAGERGQQVLFAGLAVAAPARQVCRWRGWWQGQRFSPAGLGGEGFAAGGDRAFLDRPAAEPRQRAGRRQVSCRIDIQKCFW